MWAQNVPLSNTHTLSPSLYCFAHVSWDVTSYQSLFCPSNKPFCDRWLGCVEGVKSSGRGCSKVKMVTIVRQNRGNFLFLFTVFKVITLLYLVLVCLTHIYLAFFYPTPFYLAFLSFTLFHLGRLVPFLLYLYLITGYQLCYGSYTEIRWLDPVQ